MPWWPTLVATNYARGRAFEYRVRDKLLGAGAVAVIRSAGSKGPADIVCFWLHGRPWFIQAKLNGNLPKTEMAVLMDILRKIDVKIVLASPGPKGRGVTFTDLAIGKELNV